ncbi:hypothetical protein RchiOBHm_Chr2g0147981 [Rosa chinensis]|uniref:Uncharacterized protein n=1 Tax=Rosa chinensis TaxID=74649 RepID=A0A2P6RZA2_ROSCH|nr:hypothetical protein RchiOBHm_Chr2g0147981 [Rosa chinensis]
MFMLVQLCYLLIVELGFWYIFMLVQTVISFDCWMAISYVTDML